MRGLLWVLLGIFALCGIAGCKTRHETIREYVYAEQRDSFQRVEYRLDSIHVRDSIVTFIKGDSVITDRWHTSYRELQRVDTVEKVRTRTEYLTRTEVKTVEVNRLTLWQKILAYTGALAIGGGICYAVFRVRKFM